MAIRTAVGAGQGRLLRQLLTESTLLGLLGGGLGLVLAYWGLRLLPALTPSSIPRINEVSVDTRVLAFTLGVSMLAGVLFGLAPAFHALRLNLVRALSEGGTQQSGGVSLFLFRGNATRSILAVFELALALMLLIGAGLLLKSFVRLVDVDPGYDPSNVLTLQLSLPQTRYPGQAQQSLFVDQLSPAHHRRLAGLRRPRSACPQH